MAISARPGETDYERTVRALNEYASVGDQASYEAAVRYAQQKGWSGMVPSTSPFSNTTTPAVTTPAPTVPSRTTTPSTTISQTVNPGVTSPRTTAPNTTRQEVPTNPGASVNDLVNTLSNNGGNGYGQDLRTWASQQGYGTVGWDPSTQTIYINGQAFALGAIPGTILDPETGKHIVTDTNSLSNILGGLNSPNMKNLIYQELMSQINKPTPTVEEMFAQLEPMLPELESTPVLDYEQAMLQAQGQINPLYNIATKDLLNKLARDQISRGFYGQMPGDAITQEAVATLEAQKNAQIAELANSLVGQSQQNALSRDQLNMENRSQTLSTLLNLLSNTQQQESNRTSTLMSLQDMINSNDQFERTYGLQQNELKLSEQQLAAQQELDAMESALNRTDILGYVLPQDASILGVAAGTPSWKAKEANLDRQTQLSIASMRSSSETAASKKEKEATALEQQVKAVQAKYGCNQATAVAILGVWDNPTRVSAVADITAESPGFEKQGISGDIITRALNDKWAAPEYSWLDKPQYISQR
jgi:hypothetical protein